MKSAKLGRTKRQGNSDGQDTPQNEAVNIQKRLIYGFALSWVGLAVVMTAVFWPSTDKKSSEKQNVSTVSLSDECQKTNQVKYSCYKKQLTDIVNAHGPEKAMTLIKQQYDKVSYVKTQCHQLTHVIGRAALSKYKNVADTYTHGDQFCWSGYYHGAMEQVADENGFEYVLKNANSICVPIAAKEKNSFYHYNCVHGLGHGIMFVKDGDLFASLSACDSITDSWERTSCYGGVYMQNIMYEQSPDETAGRQSKYLKADQPMYPCTVVDMKYKDQCYLMQTSYALQVVSYDFAKVFALCSQVEESFRATCYTSTGRDASGNSVSNVEQTKATCLLGPTEEAQRYCVHGAAMDFVSYFHSDQQAKQLCASLPSSLAGDCLGVVDNYYATF